MDHRHVCLVLRRAPRRDAHAVTTLVARIEDWPSTEGLSGEVARRVRDTELCEPTARQAALSVLLTSAAEALDPQLSPLGRGVAEACATVLAKCLADRQNRVALLLRYQTDALRQLKVAQPRSPVHPLRIIREAVYAAAVSLDASTTKTPPSSAGDDGAGGEFQSCPVEVDGGDQRAWVERVGGWAIATLGNRWRTESRRPNVKNPTVLAENLRILGLLALPPAEAGTVSAVNVAINRGKLTFPTRATVTAMTKTDDVLLSLLTRANLQERGDQFYNWVRASVHSDKAMYSLYRRAAEAGMQGEGSTANHLPFEAVDAVAKALVRKLLHVRVRSFLDQEGVCNQEAGFARSGPDQVTHREFLRALAVK